MLSRTVYIERGTILGASSAAPIVALLSAPPAGDFSELATYLPALPLALLILTAVGAGAGFAIHHVLRKGSIGWGGVSETSALLKQAAAELVAGQPDNKLLERATAQANAQEGRAAAIYMHSRVAQLRQAGTYKRPTKPNTIPVRKRLQWTLGLLVISAAVLIWPIFSPLLPGYGLALGYCLLASFWLTGALITGLGFANADAWMHSMLRLPTREPKLIQREVKSVAGTWHTKSSGSDIPLFRGLLVALLLIAAALYFLREYGDVYFGDDSAKYAIAPADPTPAETANRKPPPATNPAPYQREPQRVARESTQPRSSRPPQPDASAQLWRQLPDNGIAIQADLEALSYAGWDIQHIKQVFDDARVRLQNWYQPYLRDHPDAIGHIAFRITLQPTGGLSDIELISTDVAAPSFANGLKDRLEAVTLSGGALDAVSIVVALDFQP